LLNLSRAWELADTSTSRTLASKLPVLESSLTNNAKSGKNRSIHNWHWMNGLRVCSESEAFTPFLYWFSIWQTLSICWKEVPVHGTVWSGWTAKGTSSNFKANLVLSILLFMLFNSKCIIENLFVEDTACGIKINCNISCAKCVFCF